jgi:Ras-related protein Rab-18
MIVGNKVDQENARVVSREEGQALADQLGTMFVECSAKTRKNVHRAIGDLIQRIIETPEIWQRRPTNHIRVTDQHQDSSGCAC